jgi:ADP-ribose pyrophosphatase YjhB (NUDIX family)
LKSARDGEEMLARNPAGEWLIAWHSPQIPPAGTPHGADALCLTGSGEVVLISEDHVRWKWPGGRPEGDETWEETLRREILEEACAEIREARLLGFCRARCVSGPEAGRVLVRSLWRAEVELLPWESRFEVVGRHIVPSIDILEHLWMEDGFEPIYHRALFEAGLT